MAAANNKTIPTKQSPKDFIETIDHPVRRSDALTLLQVFDEVTRLMPVMWGPSIIGYGRYRYKYDSGREGEHFLTGFSPRKQNLSLYIGRGYKTLTDPHAQFGKHKTGKSCVYVNKLADIDIETLKAIIAEDLRLMRHTYETWDL